ncbi:hypothetical protein INS49_004838 [Diaporthe citri]|uniref:uncharacterized protein n=1 Tax=Diaporthe citri TaxID=83186 RepID=UPI001C807957|nr:uncharacterized protein INS49_004838 [Diaporthe citri]KAG6354234.1 hypothetical protein INS49_004838 [Diaporthe citri]
MVVPSDRSLGTRIRNHISRLRIKTVAIYTEPDSASQHVAEADISYLLDGDATRAYLDGDQIVQKARTAGAQAIIPGYGFLSEDAGFARSVAAAGLHFGGPSPESIEQFGLKHTARELALAAGVPVVPGTQGLLDDADDAARAADGLGYPVMLKSTAGGGGMGLQTCGDESGLRKAFQTVQSRGAALFKNSGVFLEKYYPAAHHIEVQVFGNGQGKVAALGERECSIQRRHQKVIEECPSPFVAQKRPDLRKQLCAAAVSLAESVKYASAGTLEFLVDDESGAFFFLEMNTRLQVEHGVTEMVYGVDLVELMLRQVDTQMAGKGGLEEVELDHISRSCQEPKGHAIEVRVYAENPARDYAPSPGLLQEVIFHELPGTRIDGCVRAGITISPHYDPLLAKVLQHAESRSQAVEELQTVLSKSSICGPPTNLDFLLAILKSPEFDAGNTITQFLSTFVFRPPAIDVLVGGSYTLVEDFPEGLEITLTGPDLRFLADAVVSLTGAAISATLDGKEFPMWRRVRISAGQRLTIGKTLSNAGCRSYLAVYGGFLNVAEWFGSKATVPLTLVGGEIPDSILPKHQEHWVVHVMHGPYCEGFLSPEDIEMFYNTNWEVSHNAARGGIRLIGPRPRWARTSGGEGGSHPSNVIEYGYPIGGVNFTGDEPVIFPNDCPDFGGFVCPFTVVKADYWKVGQLRAGNTVKFVAVSLEDALWSRKANEAFVDSIAKWLASGSYEAVQRLDATPILEAPSSVQPAVIRLTEATPSRPRIAYRQGGDDYLMLDYGNGSFDINHKCRITALKRKLEAGTGPIRFSPTGEGIYNTVCVGNSMMIYYNGLAIPQSQLLDYLAALEDELGDLGSITMPNRTFRLPLTFAHPRLKESIERYMANQRPYASYLPDNFNFVAENNGITPEEFRRLWLTAEFVCIGVGFFMALPLGLPADPRHRLNSPKMNPSRTFTPEGTVSWGGSCLAIYPVDSPGGYMLNGLTLPSCDKLGYKKGFSRQRPWLYEDMDVITFYEVSEEEYDREMALFRSGRYEFEVESTTFDMKRHNELLDSVKDEVDAIKKTQEEAQEKMVKLEKELLAKWDEEKKASGVSMESIQDLLDDPNIEAIEAPVNANVWKVLVEEGQVLEKGQVVTILEAMKMEINVAVDDRFVGSKIEKVLIQPNDIVQSGKPLVLVRTSWSELDAE